MSKSERIIGIDYGLKRVGVAIGDSEQKIALPFEILENKGFDFIVGKIRDICREEKIKEVIIGMPIALSGQKSGQTLKTEEFIRRLKDDFEIPVFTQDERLSTKEAEKIFSGNKRGKKDDVAAMVILQAYFDTNP